MTYIPNVGDLVIHKNIGPDTIYRVVEVATWDVYIMRDSEGRTQQAAIGNLTPALPLALMYPEGI